MGSGLHRHEAHASRRISARAVVASRTGSGIGVLLGSITAFHYPPVCTDRMGSEQEGHIRYSSIVMGTICIKDVKIDRELFDRNPAFGGTAPPVTDPGDGAPSEWVVRPGADGRGRGARRGSPAPTCGRPDTRPTRRIRRRRRRRRMRPSTAAGRAGAGGATTRRPVVRRPPGRHQTAPPAAEGRHPDHRRGQHGGGPGQADQRPARSDQAPTQGLGDGDAARSRGPGAWPASMPSG